MIEYRHLVMALRQLDLDGQRRPAVVHSSLSAFGQVSGGAQTLVGALLATFDSLIVPTFTYKTMLIPETGPPDNAVDYGEGAISNIMAEFYRPDMPADPLMGVVAETIRQEPGAERSCHPILSFAGINAGAALQEQSYHRPFAPIEALMEQDGWVLLMGVKHSANTSIHVGERLAGRKTFVRWALMPKYIQECRGFPSCSEAFEEIDAHIWQFSRQVRLGKALIRAIPLRELVLKTRVLIRKDPLALLCDRPGCRRCQAVRHDVEAGGADWQQLD